jgi:squalene-hopene/tetraprenyl-beta-curcumene cyclase
MRSTFARLFVAASLSLATPPCASAQETAAPAPGAQQPAPVAVVSAAESTAKALAWLVAQQKADGSFSQAQFPALTGLALWAMVGANLPQYAPNIEKATAFLLGCVQPDGGIYHVVPDRKGGGLATYNTAICLTALHATGRKDLAPTLLAARAFLAAAQETGDPTFAGGFGYDKSTDRPYADLMNTHFVLEAMRRTQGLEDLRPAGAKRADVNWDAALAFVEGLQNKAEAGPGNAGGFFYTHNDPKAGTETVDVETAAGKEERVVLRSYGSITYAGLLALAHCRLTRDDPRVVSALDWASKHWTLDENPGMGDQGLYFFYNVLGRSLRASGVHRIARPGADAVDWRAALVAKVVGLQQADGNWVNANGRFWENDPVLATSYALIALQSAAAE